MSTDITESKYSTSVRYNSDSVRLDSVLISCFFVLGNNLARFCYTRSISIWPLFSTAIFFLVFVGALTLLLDWAEKKMDYFRCKGGY